MPSILIETDLPFSGSFKFPRVTSYIPKFIMSFTSISNWIFFLTKSFIERVWDCCTKKFRTYRVVGSAVNCNPHCQYKVATESAACIGVQHLQFYMYSILYDVYSCKVSYRLTYILRAFSVDILLLEYHYSSPYLGLYHLHVYKGYV